jgi:hypothetical protein
MWMRGVQDSQLDLGICSQDGAKTAVVVVVDTSPHFASATPGTLYRNQQIIYAYYKKKWGLWKTVSAVLMVLHT